MHKDVTAVIESETPQGWPGLFAALTALSPYEPAPYLSDVSPDEMMAAQAHIRAALQELRAIKTHLNAYATDDDFGRPNGATVAIEELSLALAALAGCGT